MKQEIKFLRSDLNLETEDDVKRLYKFDYLRTSFSEYEKFKNYLCFETEKNFNLYIEMNEIEIRELINMLEDKLKHPNKMSNFGF